MFARSIALLLALTAPLALGREVIFERDGRAIVPRRFGQEQCGGLPGRIGSACRGEVCGVLGGRSIGTLLAASPECSQQDLADEIIDASKNEDAATAANMVQLAIEFRQCEKNTPPDFTTNPPALRNSVFCQKAPKNPQLNGLVQAQDPANDPELFFDPVTKSTVRKGAQANTAPFGGEAVVEEPVVEEPVVEEPVVEEPVVEEPVVEEPAVEVPEECPAPATVTVTVPAATATAPAATETAVVEEPVVEEPVVEEPVAEPPATGGLPVFQGALGGVVIPTVTDNGNGTFSVQNNATFNNVRNALNRACDVQNNQCANAANASGNREFSVGDCNAQQQECLAEAAAFADSQ